MIGLILALIIMPIIAFTTGHSVRDSIMPSVIIIGGISIFLLMKATIYSAMGHNNLSIGQLIHGRSYSNQTDEITNSEPDSPKVIEKSRTKLNKGSIPE